MMFLLCLTFSNFMAVINVCSVMDVQYTLKSQIPFDYSRLLSLYL